MPRPPRARGLRATAPRLIALCATLAALARTPRPGRAAPPPPNRLELGDLLPLLRHLLALPTVRAEIEAVTVELLLADRGVDPRQITPLVLDGARFVEDWLPRRLVVTGSNTLWPVIVRWAMASKSGDASPAALPAVAVRLDLRNPVTAAKIAEMVAGRLGLPATGADRWALVDPAHPKTPVVQLQQTDAVLTLTLRDAPPALASTDDVLVRATWDTAPPGVPLDDDVRARLGALFDTLGPGELTVKLADGQLTWTGRSPAPADPSATALFDWLPASASGFWYDGVSRFPAGALPAGGGSPVHAVFAALTEGSPPGYLIVAGAPRALSWQLGDPARPFVTPPASVPALALVVSAHEPAAAIRAFADRLHAESGLRLQPDPTGTVWSLPPDWSGPLGMAHVELTGAELHLFPGPGVVVISTDPDLSDALMAARAGKARHRPLEDCDVLCDRGGSAAVLTAVAASVSAVAPLIPAGPAGADARSGIALMRLLHAIGGVERSATRRGGFIESRGRLVPPTTTIPPPPSLAPGAASQKAETSAWFAAWCDAGGLSSFDEGTQVTLLRVAAPTAAADGIVDRALRVGPKGHGARAPSTP